MFLSPEEPKISLIADPGSPTASVSITDAAYQTVAQSVGRLEIELPAGLYKVRYETGSELVENVFELSAE